MMAIKWFKRNRQSLLNVLIFIFIGILVLMAIGFNTKYAKNTQDTLSSNSKILDQLDLSDPHSNLSKLQANNIKDNADQTLLICKIILSQNVTLSGKDAHAVEVICRQKIKDGQSTSPPSPSVKNTSQNTTLSQNKNSSTKTPSRQPGGGGTPQQPTYTQCVGSKSGILGTIMGVVSCL